jgi:uncharacterized protein YdeI (YjbR/CyaY-like superfamily)
VPDPTFFESPAELRDWLEAKHDRASELWIGFHRKASGDGGISYQEALDEALCYGWIDAVRKRLDDRNWMIRFTPRTARSIWSAVNIRRAEQLVALGRMRAAGRSAFEGRDPARANLYSYERTTAMLSPEQEAAFRSNSAAWEFFANQAVSYRRAATWWIVSAKKEETSLRRLNQLIDYSHKRQRLPAFVSPSRRETAQRRRGR